MLEIPKTQRSPKAKPLASYAQTYVHNRKGWLILSDFAEHLGLRPRATLLAAIEAAGLQVLGRLDAKPQHIPRLATPPIRCTMRAWPKSRRFGGWGRWFEA